MFSDRIKELRLKNHLTQLQLARSLQVSTSTIGMYEQGRREPDTDILRQLSRLFDVSVDHLLEMERLEESTELIKVVDHLTQQLWERKMLTFHGRKLTMEEKENVITAMKLGMRLAMDRREPSFMK